MCSQGPVARVRVAPHGHVLPVGQRVGVRIISAYWCSGTKKRSSPNTARRFPVGEMQSDRVQGELSTWAQPTPPHRGRNLPGRP